MVRKYKEPDVPFDLEESHVIVRSDFKKKMSGSRIAAILNRSAFSTPFQVACDLLGVAREDISYKHSVKAGNALEKKIIAYAKEKYSGYGTFFNSEEAFPGHGGEHGKRVCDWGDDDPYFNGNVDGLVCPNGDPNDLEDAYILEVKTTSNVGAWVDGVPEYYAMQVELYNYMLTQKDKVYFLVAFLTEEEQAKPEKFIPTEDNVQLIQYDVDLEKSEAMLAEVMEWYDTYIAQGITPDYDLTIPSDNDMWRHLCTITNTKEGMQQIVDRLEEVRSELAERGQFLQVLEEEEKELLGSIKDYMVNNKYKEIPTTSGKYKAVLSKKKSSTFDKAKMVADGIDIAKYELVKETNTLTFKPIKEEDTIGE